jgi:hypothetical protein
LEGKIGRKKNFRGMIGFQVKEVLEIGTLYSLKIGITTARSIWIQGDLRI